MKRFIFYYCENMPNSDLKGRRQRQYIDFVKSIGGTSKPNLSFENINLVGYNSLSNGPFIEDKNYLWIYKPS